MESMFSVSNLLLEKNLQLQCCCLYNVSRLQISLEDISIKPNNQFKVPCGGRYFMIIQTQQYLSRCNILQSNSTTNLKCRRWQKILHNSNQEYLRTRNPWNFHPRPQTQTLTMLTQLKINLTSLWWLHWAQVVLMLMVTPNEVDLRIIRGFPSRDALMFLVTQGWSNQHLYLPWWTWLSGGISYLKIAVWFTNTTILGV